MNKFSVIHNFFFAIKYKSSRKLIALFWLIFYLKSNNSPIITKFISWKEFLPAPFLPLFNCLPNSYQLSKNLPIYQKPILSPRKLNSQIIWKPKNPLTFAFLIPYLLNAFQPLFKRSDRTKLIENSNTTVSTRKKLINKQKLTRKGKLWA